MVDRKKTTLEKLSKLDRIELTDENTHILAKWYMDNLSYLKENTQQIKDVFDEVIIIYSNNIIHKKNNEFCMYYLENEKTGELVKLYEFDFNFEKTKEDIICNNQVYYEIKYNEDEVKDKDEAEKHLRTWINQDIQSVLYINAYTSFNQEQIIKQIKIHKRKSQSKKAKKTGKKSKIKLIKQNIIRLNTDHIQLTEEEKKQYERHTFGWTVRGHWRTYKSGKKTWIKPQVRGDKNKISGKVYQV
ncbi:hypothetical protein [Inediibacterium massiliense]|uniref:hypothetical protein n=1 Tax=Inediibacterium massiliense TaxID=1658111 RepID=UPI0006B5D58B|nr:hypothetical protein [Inediibacterium massiliense]